MVTLGNPVEIEAVVSRMKEFLGLEKVRLSKVNQTVKTVAICAGSGLLFIFTTHTHTPKKKKKKKKGGSLLNGVNADLYLTGEMGHHEVLAANARGCSVLLCEHSNTERGYLSQVLKKKLEDLLGPDVQVCCSQKDKDPLLIV